MTDPTLVQRAARKAVAGLCLAICAVALLAILAGMVDAWNLAAFGRNRVPMSSLGAAMILLLGGSILLVESQVLPDWGRRLGLGVALGVLFLSLGVAAGHALGRISAQGSWPVLGRPTSLLTCLATAVAAGSAITRWASSQPGWRARQAAALQAQIPLVIGTVVLVSYAAGAPLLYESGTTPMSLPSALCSVGLGMALMIAAGCDTWPLAVFGFMPGEAGHPRSYWFTTGPLALFLLVGVLVLTSGSFFLRSQLRTTRGRVHAELSTIAEFKAHQIGAWLAERRGAADRMFRTALIQTALRRFLAGSPQAPPEAQLRAWMENFQRGTYRRVVLFDQQGRVRMAVPSGRPFSAEDLDATELQAALRAKEVLVRDLHQHPGKPDIHLSLWVPVGASPEPGAVAEGTLLLLMDPQEFLYPLVRTWPTPSPSAETLLVRREGDDILFLNEMRHRVQPAMSHRVPLWGSQDMPAAQAARGVEGLVAGLDYRGEPVLAALHQVPGMAWGMVAKVDEAEVYGPLRKRVWIGGIGLIGVVVIVAAGLGMMVRQHDAEMIRKQLNLSQRFEWLMREANDIILLLDEHGVIREANARAVEHYGYGPGELQGLRVMDLRAPETLLEAQTQFAELKARGSVRFETIHRRRDGTVFPAEVSARLVRLDDGPMVVTFIRDITGHRTQQRELQRMTQLYAALSQVNQAIVWTGSRQELVTRICEVLVEYGRFRMAWIGWNDPATSRISVASQCGDALGYLDRLEFRSDDTPLGHGPAGTAIREGAPSICNDFQDMPGAEPWREAARRSGFASAAAFPIREGGEIRGVLAVYAGEKDFFGPLEAELLVEAAVDVSYALDHLAGEAHRRQAEAALQASERFLKAAEEAGGVGTYTWNLTEGHWRGSPYLDRLFGIGPEHPRDLGGWLEIVDPDSRADLQAYVAGVVQQRGRFDRSYPIVRPSDGARRWVHGQGEIRLDGHGRAAALVGVIQDITDQRRAEEERRALEAQLHQSQKLESLGSLAGGVAHDMNNVLGAILGIASAHREKLEPAHPMARPLDTVVSACLRGRGVVKGLLCFARKELEDVRPVDLNGLAQDMVHLLGHTTLKRVTFQVDLEEGLAPVPGDSGALSHALMNLCVNAMDAMPSGGTLTLRTRRLEDGRSELSVGDTGEGMAPEILAKAAEPFFTTKPAGKGTGLGLAMVFGTMKAHGGTLDLHSQPGAGTQAILRFPAPADGASLVQEEALPQGGAAPGAMRILLVDDDELIRESLSVLLESEGHRVWVASSGLEAIQCIQGGQDMDLVILDMNMPGLSGAETLPRILALRPGQAVLFASGHSEGDLEGLLAGYPTVQSLSKPFTMSELRRKLSGMVSGV